MIVNEIFTSIEGEGIRAGTLCTFIRFTGCNLRCAWCDTTYAFDNGTEMGVEAIMSQIPDNVSNITLTGGEPLLQEDIGELIRALAEKGYNINIETNGSVDYTPYISMYFGRVIITADYKLPSSKMEDRMLDIRTHLSDRDVLKFVIGSEEDLQVVKEILTKENIKAHIYLSPVFGMIEPVQIVDWMKEKADLLKGKDVRIQVQLHKVIWDKDTRGV